MRKALLLAPLALVLAAACAKAPAPAPAPEAATPAPMTATMDGKALYAAKCAGCHGADGSKGVKGKSSEFITTALTGYRAKTYGGAKKEIMQARAAQLSDEDIKKLADFIPTL